MIAALLLLSIVAAQPSYDAGLSLQLAYMSEVSFDPLDQITSWTCPNCSRYDLQDISAFINRTLDIQGFVGYCQSRDAIIASFRGSVDIQNWLANVDVIQVTYARCSNCKIHKGFYDAYKQVTNFVNTHVALLREKYGSPAIYVTGHSLGGALAVVSAMELKATFGKVDLVYTTGQPRVGNSYLADYINKNLVLYRLVHWSDVVPHSPASGVIMAFKHGGTEVWYTEDMQSYKLCQSEDSKCANSIGMMSRTTRDHNLRVYYLTLPVTMRSLRTN